MFRFAPLFLPVLWALPHTAFGQVCNASDPAVSLDMLGVGSYKTFQGGLYAGGSNARPAEHDAAGRALAAGIVPINTAGEPSPSGRIVLISIGFSNMTQEWKTGAVGEPDSVALTFYSKATALQASGEVNPRVLIVDGAQGGETADHWGASPPDTGTSPWSVALARLAGASSSAEQVQVACVKTADSNPNTCIAPDGSTLGDAGLLAARFAGIARNLRIVFPHIKLAYFVSRTYGGYAISGLNPEPYAYECAFGVKWMIDAQVKGAATYGDLHFDGASPAAPWLAWGPYLWSHGATPNGSGIFWLIDDFRASDRTHPSGSGVDKAGTGILNFFLSDSTTRPWFGWQCLHGDVDNNGVIDSRDIRAFVQVLMNPASSSVGQRCRADVDDNGIVNLMDVPSLVNILLGA